MLVQHFFRNSRKVELKKTGKIKFRWISSSPSCEDKLWISFLPATRDYGHLSNRMRNGSLRVMKHSTLLQCISSFENHDFRDTIRVSRATTKPRRRLLTMNLEIPRRIDERYFRGASRLRGLIMRPCCTWHTARDYIAWVPAVAAEVKCSMTNSRDSISRRANRFPCAENFAQDRPGCPWIEVHVRRWSRLELPRSSAERCGRIDYITSSYKNVLPGF